MLLSTFLAATVLLGQLKANINEITLQTVSDPELIETYLVASDHGYENGSDMRELFLKVPVDEKELSELLELQNEDGSFKDVDYDDQHRGAWPPGIHGFRVQRLAIHYRQTSNKQALDAALKAMRFWFERKPVCPNWWHNEIGIPRLMGPAFLLLEEEMSPSDLEGAIYVMGKARIRMTGQNKIWLSGNVLIRGLLENDEALVREARDTIAAGVRISDDYEGLQKDWSFHQHGPQLQFGNYGLSYATSLSFWARAFEGTEFAFDADRIAVLRGYLENGLTKVVWRGWFDHNACGRQVFLNAQMGKALCALEAARNLGVEPSEKIGAVYYPTSDFGIFRGRGWYASIRMQSLHTKGYETTNSENMRGYFSADGALLVRRAGDEYNNVSPVWNWRHVPGTTTWDDGTDIYCGKDIPDHNGTYYNLTEKVGGIVKGRTMTVWMDYNRDSLTAHKAWVFLKDCIVCVGAGITRQGSAKVATTVNQCLLRGKIEAGSNWVSHDGITYVVLDGSAYTLNNGPHTGSWRPISPTYSEEPVTADLFEMYLDHGVSPENASYAYVIAPSGSQGEKAAKRLSRRIRIVENTPERQIIRVGFRKFVINWD